MRLFSFLASALLLALSSSDSIASAACLSPPPPWTHSLQQHSARSHLYRRDVNYTALYPPHNISTPVDHFHNDSLYAPHSNGTFNMRYWYDATFYKPGGPVILLGSGETSGEDRLPFLQKGIVYILAKATGGLGVILEHRYYGESFPVPDLSTPNLRFLTTQQALADAAYFAQNVRFEGLDVDADLLKPDKTPWIAYGGSYAGGFVAFLRLLYPGVYWGAISSSGVTKAIFDYWQYNEPIRIFGPQDCVHTTQKFVDVIDNVLLDDHPDEEAVAELKDLFGLGNLTDNVDFANLLGFGIGSWQGRNWEPEISDPSFGEYCGNITSDRPLYTVNATANSTSMAPGDRQTAKKLIADAGESVHALTERMLNWAGYVKNTEVGPCAESGRTQDQCFTYVNETYFHQDDIAQQGWRSWGYQYCTQWGYYQTGSGVPDSIKPLISRTIDIEYLSFICRAAFNITELPDLDAINQYGGFDIEYERLAFIDGQEDPWREAGTHAFRARPREDTIEEPFVLIEGAVHHWDENGVLPNETTPDLPPTPVRETQEYEVEFVKAWVDEWNEQKRPAAYLRRNRQRLRVY